MQQSTLDNYQSAGNGTADESDSSGIECPTCGRMCDDKRGLGVHHSSAHDISIREYEKREDGADRCGQCGTYCYVLADHWTKSENCTHPSFTDRQQQIIDGLVMGDAAIGKSLDPSKERSNPWIIIDLIAEPFLDWLDDTFGCFGKGVTQRYTAEESMARPSNNDWEVTDDVENWNAVYNWRSIAHPELRKWREWYDDEHGKIIPIDEIDLTPLTMSVWFCCDGFVARPGDKYRSRNSPRHSHKDKLAISAVSETKAGRGGDLAAAIEDQTPFHCRSDAGGKLYFRQSQTEDILSWMEGPLPGFERKWNVDMS